jgi:Fe-S-cluster containining protein
MSDVLKKEIHPILHTKVAWKEVKPSLHHPYESNNVQDQPLPKEEKAKPGLLGKIKHTPIDVIQQDKIRRRLNVMYSTITIPPDKVPPCGTCKAAPCCKSYIVPILKEEYESGIYGDYAVKLTKEALQALATQKSPAFRLNASPGQDEVYVLEGHIGEACPFLGADNKCTIYEYRPRTCRVYTCLEDERITQELRDGTVDPIFAGSKPHDDHS